MNEVLCLKIENPGAMLMDIGMYWQFQWLLFAMRTWTALSSVRRRAQLLERRSLSGILDSLQKKPGRIPRGFSRSELLSHWRIWITRAIKTGKCKFAPWRQALIPMANGKRQTPNKREKRSPKLACSRPGDKQAALQDGWGNPETQPVCLVSSALNTGCSTKAPYFFLFQTWKHVVLFPTGRDGLFPRPFDNDDVGNIESECYLSSCLRWNESSMVVA